MDPRKRRTIDALTNAAERIFSERAVDEVTVEEIANAAGVSVVSIYNNFGSKAGLHAAVVVHAIDTDRRYMDLAYTPDRDPVAQLHAAAEQYLEFYLRHPAYFRMLAFPGGPGQYAAGQELSDQLARSVDEQNRRLADALADAVERGLLRPVDPRRLATVLWSAWNGIISLNWRPDQLRAEETELRQLLATASEVIVRGLLP